MNCPLCGAADTRCGGPTTTEPIDQEVTDMVVSMPRKGTVRTEPREMVRIQLKPNDIRSYTREEAEELIAKTPGAFIIGEEPGDEPKVKAQRSAPNKARQPKPAGGSQSGSAATVPTKSDPPAESPTEPKAD